MISNMSISKIRILQLLGILIIMCSFLLSSYYAYHLYFKKTVIISFNNDNMILNYNDEYEDSGVVASLCNKISCEDISDKVVVTSNIENNILGNYSVNYEIEYNNVKYEKEKTVMVVDHKQPELILKGDIIEQDNMMVSRICPNQDYTEEGYSAYDEYDGDITNKVVSIKKEDKIEYYVMDSSHNISSKIRHIKKEDISNPTLTLKGPSTITLNNSQNYIEYGAIANDNCDGNLTSNIKITSNVNVYQDGNYTVTYSVSDSANNTTTITRKVRVVSMNTKEQYLQELEEYIKSNNYKMSIGYVNLKTGYTYKYNSDAIYYGASLAKTMDALYIYENNITDPNIINDVKKAISVSDNTAHRNLVNYIGINNLRNYAKNIGTSIFLNRSDKDYYGNTNVDDQIAIWKYVYNYVNTKENGQEMKSYFVNNFYNSLIFEGLPQTMHKYGWYGNYYHDVGIVSSNNPYIIVILTKHGSNDYKQIVNNISHRIYEFNKIDK